ncbi:MAG: pyruvate, phosphate dikinase [Acetobacterium sp.]
MSKKWVYLFKEGNAEMKALLGGKGANLAEMTNIGLPVPQGFTVTTEACTEYYNQNKKLSPEITAQIDADLEILEAQTEKQFGNKENPLLVSVRSGAKFSMPGMMDTILNLGLNDETVAGIAKITNNERFAFDSYRRFIQMFGDVVQEIHKDKFDKVLEEVKEKNNYSVDTQLEAKDLKEIVAAYKNIIKTETGEDFPMDPKVQLLMAIEAVFRSWNNNRAISYRNMNDIPHDIGTAVTVQSMVYGNMGDDSGTGVAFTRNPATGQNKLFGEFLINAQGEDVVAGIRTPKNIDELQDIMPEIYKQFHDIAKLLENHYKDMQDIEFTIEKGKLYMLQTRTGKRTAAAALCAAVDMVKEGLITREEAILRLDPLSLDQLLHPTFEAEALKNAELLATGLPASPGAATGKVYFTAEAVCEAVANGEETLLVRKETSPEDIEGMYAANGILTARGGMTSHAAVVARGMGKCCVAGCETIKVDEAKRQFIVNGEVFKEGDYISLNGSTGKVYKGSIKTVTPELSGHFGEIMAWADEFKTLNVRTNADTPHDARVAIRFGAEGIGLCRTEHMFFDEKRLPSVRRMILSESKQQREKALAEILPMQKEDFIGIYTAMESRPVTVRLLDPPLHEFLPKEEKDIKALAEDLGTSYEDMMALIQGLEEFNPMLGHRGCRLAITFPEIAEMQTRAIMEAAIEVKEKYNFDIVPEIMIPLVGIKEEFTYLDKVVRDIAELVKSEKKSDIKYLVGTMIEIPRATLIADKIAETAEFFSFGTNDLTQMTYGFSRDDAGSFITDYKEKGILPNDPFQSIDVEGVGALVQTAVILGRQTKPQLKMGVCGEHGGDPKSIYFFHKAGLNYVSCSPFRVPIARLAAAQAALGDK